MSEEVKDLPPATHQRLASGEIVPLEQTTPVDLLAKALEKGVDTETLRQFMDLQERYEANEARKAYAADMAKCQKTMEPIVAASENDHTSSYYAKLGYINKQITPIYAKYGFSISFGHGKADLEGDIRTTATVLHKLGHREGFHIDLPPDDVGSAGKTTKTAIHARKSSNTYGRRAIIEGIFNLSIMSEDDDGNAAGGSAPGRITEDQALELDALVSENELNHVAIQREFRVAGWPQIPANKFEKVKARIMELIKARKGRR